MSRRRWAVALGWLLILAAVGLALWWAWRLVAVVTLLVAGVAVRDSAGPAPPENLAQVAQRIHQEFGVSVSRSWELMGEAKDALGSEDPALVWEEARARQQDQ